MTIKNYDYWKEIREIASDLIKDIRDENPAFNDDDLLDECHDRLYEIIDSHQWVIYYGNNLSVLEHSDNREFMVEHFGVDDVAQVLKEKGINGLHSALAYWAMFADTLDQFGVLMNQESVA